MRAVRVMIIVSLFAIDGPDACAAGFRFSTSLSGSITSSSKLFANPHARDDVIRGLFSPINSVFGIGADARVEIPMTGLKLGLGAEYLSTTVAGTVPNASITIPVEDGYYAIPVELTAYFSIPIGGEKFDFYMGGGAGIYFGERVYRYAGVGAETIGKNLSPGIHILTGLEYLVGPGLAIRTEFKFRTVQLESVQEFPTFSTVYGGATVPLPQGEIVSRVQIDGMQFSLGVAYRFP